MDLAPENRGRKCCQPQGPPFFDSKPSSGVPWLMHMPVCVGTCGTQAYVCTMFCGSTVGAWDPPTWMVQIHFLVGYTYAAAAIPKVACFPITSRVGRASTCNGKQMQEGKQGLQSFRSVLRNICGETWDGMILLKNPPEFGEKKWETCNGLPSEYMLRRDRKNRKETIYYIALSTLPD
uniref:Uncharacterized protein n=1 Tax=Eutreptiella gymnastica TaxID=73025 RepID=A0A7S1I3S6_9EUGL